MLVDVADMRTSYKVYTIQAFRHIPQMLNRSLLSKLPSKVEISAKGMIDDDVDKVGRPRVLIAFLWACL